MGTDVLFLKQNTCIGTRAYF